MYYNIQGIYFYLGIETMKTSLWHGAWPGLVDYGVDKFNLLHTCTYKYIRSKEKLFVLWAGRRISVLMAMF